MAQVIGVAAMPVMVGQMFGPSLGGLILTYLDWHWICFVDVSVGLIAIGFARVVLPADEATNAGWLVLVGFALVSPGLALLLQGLMSLAHGNPEVSYSLIASTVLLAAFALHALRHPAFALIWFDAPAQAYAVAFWVLARVAVATLLAASSLPGRVRSPRAKS